jgi:HEAT repeat protein
MLPVRLLELIRDAEGEVRIRAAEALGRVAGQAGPEAAGRAVERLLEFHSEAGADMRVAIARLASARGAERALPTLLEWLHDTRYSIVGGFTHVNQVAYSGALAILARAAPEPPADFEEPPQPVAGPWDKDSG